MEEVCCGCRKKISEKERRDILAEDPAIRFQDESESRRIYGNLKRIKLSDAIELITGAKIDRTTERFVNLCNDCFEKVESYINFRARLLASFIDSTTRNVRYERIVVAADHSGNQDTSEVISVDEDNQTTEQISSSTDEVDTSDRHGEAKLRNDQVNNNLIDSEISSDTDELSVSSAYPKVQENDIESEIDVCSGEDDEVFELDYNGIPRQIVLAESSESDLEVCDYEPTGKRIKNYHHTLSS